MTSRPGNRTVFGHHVASRARVLPKTLIAICALIALVPKHAAAQDSWTFTDPAVRVLGNVSEKQNAPENQDLGLPDPATIDWSILNTDARNLDMPARAAAPTTAAHKLESSELGWSRTDKREGVSALTVKQPVLPFWDTRVGADLNVAGQSTSPIPLPEKFATDGKLSQSSGAAWAAATAPGLGSVWDKTAIEARLDPSQDQSKIGTSLSKSLPLDGSAYSLTLQSGYNIIEQSLVPTISGSGRAARIYQLDRSAKFNISDTGTSFVAGQSLSTADDKWLKSMGAEQKLFGGVSITGSVSETAAGNLNKSLSAGFKSTW